jgi:fructose-bisphosphate aldolase, class I
MNANAYVLARYARICQDAGMVPIVEPEVLFDGTHSSERCEEVMTRTLDALFDAMRTYKVHLPAAILKTSMVLPGKNSGTAIDYTDVADRTCRVLYHHVPHELAGIVFLSGGQPPKDAFINLNRIVQRGPFPWGVTFSYSRALQDAVLKAWAKHPDDIAKIQDIFHRHLVVASAASKGELDESTLEDDGFVSHSQDV